MADVIPISVPKLPERLRADIEDSAQFVAWRAVRDREDGWRTIQFAHLSKRLARVMTQAVLETWEEKPDA